MFSELAVGRVYSHSAYGLNLASALPLPDLLPGAGQADVHIQVTQSNHRPEFSGDSPIQCVSVSPTRAHLTWGAVGDLLIEEGMRITVIPGAEADDQLLRLFLLGAGLGVLLHQRGLLVLHASAVGLQDRAVGFLGAKGWGKSTTAAALHHRGHPLVADELLVIRFDDRGRPLAIPGPSQVKLWEDALIGLGRDPESADSIAPGTNKYYVHAAAHAQDIPVTRLYLLGASDELCVQPMSLAEAFMGVVPHVYVSRFGTSFLKSSRAVGTFRQLTWLLKEVPVLRLLRKPDLAQLNEIARMVESDCLQ